MNLIKLFYPYIFCLLIPTQFFMFQFGKEDKSFSPPTPSAASRPVPYSAVQFRSIIFPLWSHSVPSISTVSQPVIPYPVAFCPVPHSSIQFSPVLPSVIVPRPFPHRPINFRLVLTDYISCHPVPFCFTRSIISWPVLFCVVPSRHILSRCIPHVVLLLPAPSNPTPSRLVLSRLALPNSIESRHLPSFCIDSRLTLFRYILSSRSNPTPVHFLTIEFSTSLGHSYSRPIDLNTRKILCYYCDK